MHADIKWLCTDTQGRCLVKFGREEVLPWRGRYFTRILSLGGEFVLRIFSPPEEISGGRFYPVTPGNITSSLPSIVTSAKHE